MPVPYIGRDRERPRPRLPEDEGDGEEGRKPSWWRRFVAAVSRGLGNVSQRAERRDNVVGRALSRRGRRRG